MDQWVRPSALQEALTSRSVSPNGRRKEFSISYQTETAGGISADGRRVPLNQSAKSKRSLRCRSGYSGCRAIPLSRTKELSVPTSRKGLHVSEPLTRAQGFWSACQPCIPTSATCTRNQARLCFVPVRRLSHLRSCALTLERRNSKCCAGQIIWRSILVTFPSR